MPDCDVCQWAKWRAVEVTDKTFEWMYFGAENTIRQLVFEADEDGEYRAYLTKLGSTGESDGTLELFSFTGPGIVTVPFPSAGVGVQQWLSIAFTGGKGKLTVFLDDANQTWIRSKEID